jgi:glycopeptide antibiotics resistance protein
MMVDMESVFPVLVPGLAVWLWYLRARRRFTAGRLIACAGFAVYLLLVSNYTVFPLRFDSGYIEAFRAQSRFLDGVNLVPLKGWSLKYLASVQGWGNILLGVPWGFMYPFVVPVLGWLSMMRSGVILGAAIEFTQFVISLLYGFAYRVIDINDVLLNFAGVMLGYALLIIMARSYQAVSRHRKRAATPRSAEPWEHFESVLLSHGRSGGASL